MKALKRVCVAAFGVAALTSSRPAACVPVVAGSPVIFNFASPAPGPFATFNLNFGIDICTVFESYSSAGCLGTDMPDAGTITIYDGLNGSGASGGLVGSWNDSSFSGSIATATGGPYAAITDGRFSLRYAASVGGLDAAPRITLADSHGVITFVDGVGVAAVPEPESIALLGIGVLAGLEAARRRRRRSPAHASVRVATDS